MNIQQKISNIFKILKNEITWIKKEINCEKVWIGNIDAGFYIYPKILNTNSIVYSFGLGTDISFDLGLINKYGCMVYGFDPTPKSIEWVKSHKLPPNFVLKEYGIDVLSGIKSFNLPINDTFVSGSLLNHDEVTKTRSVEVLMKSFEDIINDSNHRNIDLIKMDIEGSEFEVVEFILNSGVVIKQFAIEIHERFFQDGKDRVRKLLDMMNVSGYLVFGVSDSMQEISFIKKEFVV